MSLTKATAEMILRTIVSKTANYSAVDGDDTILCDASGGAFTVTLPTAVGVKGKTYRLKKTDSTFTAITIATTSAQTIDGVSTRKLNTQYESWELMSDGANWSVVHHKATTPWKNDLTFTVNGLGTIANANFWYKRIGDTLFVDGSATSGTPAASAASIQFPSGIAIDTAKRAATANVQEVGSLFRLESSLDTIFNTANAEAQKLFYDGSTTDRVFLAYQIQSGAYLKANGSGAVGSSEVVSFTFKIPVSGWDD